MEYYLRKAVVCAERLSEIVADATQSVQPSHITSHLQELARHLRDKLKWSSSDLSQATLQKNAGLADFVNAVLGAIPVKIPDPPLVAEAERNAFLAAFKAYENAQQIGSTEAQERICKAMSFLAPTDSADGPLDPEFLRIVHCCDLRRGTDETREAILLIARIIHYGCISIDRRLWGRELAWGRGIGYDELTPNAVKFEYIALHSVYGDKAIEGAMRRSCCHAADESQRAKV